MYNKTCAYFVKIEGFNGDDRLFTTCDEDNKKLAIDYAKNINDKIKSLHLNSGDITVRCCLTNEIVYTLNNKNKYYCIDFRTHYDLKDNFKGWYIEYTDKIEGYSSITDKYSKKQIFRTLDEAKSNIPKGDYFIIIE